MKKTLRFAVLTISVIGMVAAWAAAPTSFGQLVDNLDQRKNTKLHAQQYWKGVKGQEITWSGEVVEVDGGSSKAKIYVADRSRPLYKGYNVVVSTGDIAKASAIKKGQKVRFKGVLSDYDQKDAGAVVEIKDAIIL